MELFRDVLNATHQELPYYPTLYSNIYDLKKGLIYLYYYHDFENVVVIDVAAELAKGFHYYSLASLFPSNTEAVDFERQHTTATETQIANRVTPIGLGQLDEYAGEYRVRVGSVGEMVSLYVEAERLYAHQRFSLPIAQGQ